MATEAAGGTQACTIGTEHTLTTQTTAGTFVLGLDLTPLADGDTLEVRIKTILRSGMSEAASYMIPFLNSQDTDNHVVYSDPIPITSTGSVKFTIKQTAGTGRTFTWVAMQL